MKTASVLDLPQGMPAILAWLHDGETVPLLESNGDPIGRIVPVHFVRIFCLTRSVDPQRSALIDNEIF